MDKQWGQADMNETYTLEVEDLSVRYGGVLALSGLSLKLKRGQIRALIGPNGAGKSTAIDAISGRRPAILGKVFLGGRDISRLTVVQRRFLGLSRSFQRTSIFPNMRVLDQIDLAASRKPESNPGEILVELGLDKLQYRIASEIGYGDQRRLDLALALVGQPSVLLLDEPMAGLSLKESWDLAEHLQRITRDLGVSMLLVEHDMEIVFGISGAITVLESGKVIADGEPASVRANEHVRAAYLGSAA
ncbi:MAG: ATP-binding cassette domain-containing protein [Desulfatirhabdiaceae bacterium]